jgi:hypothetical protein
LQIIFTSLNKKMLNCVTVKRNSRSFWAVRKTLLFLSILCFMTSSAFASTDCYFNCQPSHRYSHYRVGSSSTCCGYELFRGDAFRGYERWHHSRYWSHFREGSYGFLRPYYRNDPDE